MENTQIADVFDEIADLLDLKKANPFRIRSYRNAARTLRNLSERVAEMDEDDWSALPDIGESTAAKIGEILETGTCQRLDDLREELPEGLTEVMRIPGVGPRKAMQLHRELDIDTVDDLKQACREHKVRELDGMGAKTEANIRRGIATIEGTAGRLLYRDAADHLASLSEYLDGLAAVDRWETAGSFRRGRETVGDLDILVHAGERGAAADAILDYGAIDEVIGRGQEKVSVRLEGGLQIDFRFFDTPAFGAALMYFTGSKAHNIKLRRLAQDNDWKLNEYGLFKNDRRLAGKTEESVYQRLNLPWIAPELREDRGEIEAARDDALPDLIELDDVRGDLQCHTTASDGKQSIRDMAEAAQALGLDYLAITDHSQRVTMANGLDDDRARRHADAIRDVDADMNRFWLLAGIEVDILKSGKLDLREKTLAGLDWVVASVHYDRTMSRKAMTDRIVSAIESGVVHCLAHPLGRMIGKREPIDVDMDKIVAACLDHGVRLEINCQPDRLDLPETYARDAHEAGVGFTLGTDAHSTEGLHAMRFGVNVARRAWLSKDAVLNCTPLTRLRKTLA